MPTPVYPLCAVITIFPLPVPVAPEEMLHQGKLITVAVNLSGSINCILDEYWVVTEGVVTGIVLWALLNVIVGVFPRSTKETGQVIFKRATGGLASKMNNGNTLTSTGVSVSNTVYSGPKSTDSDKNLLLTAEEVNCPLVSW